ncbi:U3 associated protein Utp25 [Schizosaccharomyces japonicus yFS275]|uniref:U3 small nucleolar RNA-associated protein 25 n=1 Tax=Schizosaccharomyces japonicus (strain yFS275 / FY16936) TaxID=402676 RepID=UTP25_SCHJY|nr:U3 associated protein Utp25 [Schizosaccharomyces japonicus yFS275]B6JX19.1 RecName: Full=U3 small nucleolar RNA-associated protein 25; Short=U3 snoRNA-associated protein 25; AltName: Full=U three protein 25 [Schizosaccharomyces japonicus yFS275]EEB05920.1 U3 associated protein Utp25 [Schizosaccharomyces japonicus yFS275]
MSDLSKDELANDAYQALLVMLKSDGKHKLKEEEAPRKRQKRNKVTEKLSVAQEPEEDEENIEDAEQESASEVQELLEAGDHLQEDEVPKENDPFHTHYEAPSTEELASAITKLNNGEIKKENLDCSLGVKQIQQVPSEKLSLRLSSFAPANVSDLKLKQRLLRSYLSIKPSGNMTNLQCELAKHIFNYEDVLFSNVSSKCDTLVRNLYTLHAINHVYKVRDHVLKNSAKLSQNQELEFRDQGYTRPKVLILLPTRNACLQFVETLIQFTGAEQVENRKRFSNEFSIETEVISEKKPEDFRQLFAGNTDDMFRLGIKFTRKTIKLFSQFYNSDIIVASPLGLRMAIGNKSDKKRDFDYLSSIEVAIVDQADALLMQNWEHLEYVFEHMNKLPKNSHGCDFSRVRPWYLEEQSRYLRQTLMFSHYNAVDINAFYLHEMLNLAGRVKFHPKQKGVLNSLGYHITQTFARVQTESLLKVPDARFEHFTSTLVPQLLKNAMGGILVYIPSYFDYVRVRNYFEDEAISYVSICEYTKNSDISRARTQFYQNRKQIMLYTERAHHFRRFDFRGVRGIIMYAPPTNAQFYVELTRMPMRSISDGILDADAAKCRVLYTKYDMIPMEPIVGSERVTNMCKGKHDIYEFV